MNINKQFKEGLITNNPVLVQLIGMCATMAIPPPCLTALEWAFPFSSS